jgi:ankyrin repeat protein
MFYYVNLLIKNGADVNKKDKDYLYGGTTALMFASGKGSIEIVKSLITAGADINAKKQ